MSPRSRRRREARATARAAGGRRWPLRIALLVTAGVVIALAAVWRTRPGAGPARDAGAGLSTEAVVDSQRAALAAGAWDRTVTWAGVLAARSPRDPMRVLGLALAWHNHAWGGAAYGRTRAATRTSLDRITMELRAFTLLDSATALARAPEDWARVRRWRAEMLENLGLPVDALQGYDEVLRNAPDFPNTRARAQWVLGRLQDPLGGGEAPPAE